MAQEAGAVLPHSAQVVANVFVEQYYKVLHQSPAYVFRFYQDSSLLSRPDSDGKMTTVTTMEAINEKILSFNYEDCIVEIETADAQDSYQQGITVLVTGSITGKDNVTKKFIQTFFLAPQDKGYFVLNDVLRFLKEKNSKEREFVENGVTESAPTTFPTTSPEPAQIPDQPTEDISNFNEEESQNDVAEVCNPSENGDGSVCDGEIVDSPPQLSDVEVPAALDVAPASQDDAPKKSYASILKVMGNSAPSSGHIPSRTAVAPVTKVDNRSLASAKAAPEPAPAIPANENASEKNLAEEEAEGYSVYVKNLPQSATVGQLQAVFQKFGRIKHEGIQVRSNKGFCFGFVEFESQSSMQSALEASPVIIGDRQAGVEEKRTSTKVGAGGRGKFGSGRGGFRGDNFRGRGNFGGVRGSGRTDYKTNGEFSGRPKGSAVYCCIAST